MADTRANDLAILQDVRQWMQRNDSTLPIRSNKRKLKEKLSKMQHRRETLHADVSRELQEIEETSSNPAVVRTCQEVKQWLDNPEKNNRLPNETATKDQDEVSLARRYRWLWRSGERTPWIAKALEEIEERAAGKTDKHSKGGQMRMEKRKARATMDQHLRDFRDFLRLNSVSAVR